MPRWIYLIADNDNVPASNDPIDYEDFDPAELPPDFFYEDDTPIDVCTFMSRFA